DARSVSSLYAPRPPRLYALALHDALPISGRDGRQADACTAARRAGNDTGALRRPCAFKPGPAQCLQVAQAAGAAVAAHFQQAQRSEEHTSELQSRENRVCRLLLAKKNTYR